MMYKLCIQLQTNRELWRVLSACETVGIDVDTVPMQLFGNAMFVEVETSNEETFIKLFEKLKELQSDKR